VGMTVAGSAVWPTSSMAQCNSYCTVGALGQGGVSSDGNARGFRSVTPGQAIPGAIVTNVGNPDAGHIDVSLDGEVLGTLDGTYHDGACIGLATGVFGDYHGRITDC
jgi:hypothetical protein